MCWSRVVSGLSPPISTIRTFILVQSERPIFYAIRRDVSPCRGSFIAFGSLLG
nr:MAG TPA: hypothetical protein [Caudoviricetes sp.]